jgi:3-oxoacyl-[acyl-carrier-protein] synthase II
VTPVIAHVDMTTAYGRGTGACWQGLLDGQHALSSVTRFDTSHHRTQWAGIVDGLDPAAEPSLCMQMLAPVLATARPHVQPDTAIVLGCTNGEIDLLQRAVLAGKGTPADSRFTAFLEKIEDALGLGPGGTVVSAACASGTAALAQAASLVQSGTRSSALVVCCDCVSEFVFAGFSSLMALTPDTARPFDTDRAGLTIGEAAVCVLVCGEPYARARGLEPLAGIAGWGLTNDANHMTGPSRDGNGLAEAIAKALAAAGEEPEAIASICAHGTGTPYNDSMEMKALQRAFPGGPRPTYSVKGAIGHTMGPAGLLEIGIAIRAQRERIAPPTVGCRHVDPEAEGWVAPHAQPTQAGPVLSMNSGFGGINAAVVLR